MGNSRLGNTQLFLDASNTDSVLEAVSFGDMKTLRRKMGRGVFQPGEDLEPYGIGKGFKRFYNLFWGAKVTVQMRVLSAPTFFSIKK